MYCRYKWKWRICQKDGNFQELLGQRLSRVHYFEKSKDCSQVTSAWIATSEALIYGCEVMQKYSLCWVDLEDKRRRGVLITFHVARALHFLQSYRHFHPFQGPSVGQIPWALCLSSCGIFQCLSPLVFWSGYLFLYLLLSLEGVLQRVQDESTACIL